MAKIYNWFQERLEIQAIADDISSKYVPPHVNIFYCFGGIVFTVLEHLLNLIGMTMLPWR